MPETVADYSDAVRRIVRAEVPPNATSEAEIQAALSATDSPQVTREIADEIADKVVSEERVMEALDGRGELPTRDAIDASTDLFDDYDLDGRVEEVADAVAERVATQGDVAIAVESRRQSTDGPTFREEVETAVDEVSRDKQFVGSSPEEVTTQTARDIGAPSETNFRREATQAVAGAEQVNPSEVVEETGAQTPVQVLRDESGQTVAATGGPSEDLGQQVADEVGAEYLSTEEVVEEMSTAGTGSSVDLTLRGRKIGEVDVE